MKIISGIFALLVLVPVLCFALSNRQDAAVAFWPFEGAIQIPLYLVGLLPLAFGLLFGAFWGWVASMPHRLKSRRLNKELDALNNRIGDLQKAAIVQQAQIEPKRPFWARKR
jgi:uncharacterized integral membrane protein